MKRSFIITLALIAAIAVPLCASSGWARGLGVLWMTGGGAVSSAGPTCTGTMLIASNDNESFEYGADDFCASDWTAANFTGVDTYSTAYAHCGTHSLSLTVASPLSFDLGVVTDKYFRFYVKTANLGNDLSTYLLQVFKYSGFTIPSLSLTYKDNSAGGTTSEIYNALTPTYKFIVTEGDELRVEGRLLDNGSNITVSFRVYRRDGAAWVAIESSEGAGIYIITHTVSVDTFRYAKFGGGSSTGPVALYYDDLQWGSGWLGDATCD